MIYIFQLWSGSFQTVWMLPLYILIILWCILFSANPGALPEQELLILHTPSAHEWSAYLHHILKSSKKLRKRSIFQYTISPADELHGYNFECFQHCKCILLIFTGELLDMLCDPNLQEALQTLLYPPQRVVALLCGVSEDDVMMESFEDWPRWRKLSAVDEPPVYISTVLESIADSAQKNFHIWLFVHSFTRWFIPVALKEHFTHIKRLSLSVKFLRKLFWSFTVKQCCSILLNNWRINEISQNLPSPQRRPLWWHMYTPLSLCIHFRRRDASGVAGSR